MLLWMLTLVVYGVIGVGTVFAATLSLSPSTGVYTSGAVFTANVVLNTQGAPINAAEGILKFNPNQLEVVGLGQTNSIFNLWTIEPTFSNSAGTVSFGGGSPRGYTGSAGTIMSIRFRAKGAGASAVSFSSGSALAADGQGTNVLSKMNGGSYTIAAQADNPAPEEIVQYVAPANTPGAPNVSSATHADTDAWYTATTAQFSWSLPAGVTAVRTGLSKSPSTIPSVVFDPPITSRTVEDLEQGVSYFHVQFQNENGWGKVTHYKIAIDTEKPSDFAITLLERSELHPVPTLKFDVTDSASDVRRYIIQLDGGEGVEYLDQTGSSTFALGDIAPGRHSVVVEAFDQAGNSIVANYAFDIASFEAPTFTSVPERFTNDIVPVFTGTTRPESAVTVNLRLVGIEQSAFPETAYQVNADSEGKFVVIPDGTFGNGIYEITAVAIDPFGTQSDMTAALRFVVSDPGYVQVGSILINFLSILIPVIILVLALFVMLVYLFARGKRIVRYIITETKEAEDSVRTAFSDLTQTLNEQSEFLTASRKTKKLTKAEEELVDTMHTALVAAERKVLKEVSDVDDIVT